MLKSRNEIIAREKYTGNDHLHNLAASIDLVLMLMSLLFYLFISVFHALIEKLTTNCIICYSILLLRLLDMKQSHWANFSLE